MKRDTLCCKCKSKIRKRQYCRTCDSFKHGDENCPHWRSYITKLPSQGEMRKAQFYQEFTVTTVHQMSILVMNVINRDPPEYLILVVHLVETIYPKIQKPLFQKRLRAASNSRIGDEEYRPTTSTRDYTSNFTPSSRYEGFGSQGFHVTVAIILEVWLLPKETIKWIWVQ